MKIEEKKSGETAREYAYHTIRDNIISLELEPGAPFNDIEVSQQIGISRTPVREAVIQLSEESRIIQIFPQIIGEHRELLDAIRSKDTKRAVETMDRHLNNWMLNEKLFREQYPQYFK